MLGRGRLFVNEGNFAMLTTNRITPDEMKALRHIVKNGDDRNLQQKRWQVYKSILLKRGLIQRRIGDWCLIPTSDGREALAR